MTERILPSGLDYNHGAPRNLILKKTNLNRREIRYFSLKLLLSNSIRHTKMSKLYGRRRFERQVLRHLDSLYFVALKLTGHCEDAEDLVQETYFKAFNHRNQLRDLKKCKPWLYRIMINTWKNWAIKRSREVFPENQEHWEDSTAQHADGNLQTHQINPDQNLMIKELWEDVDAALTRLSPNYRWAVILSDIEGFSYKEISKIMNLPMGTDMSTLSRARRQLGHFLIKYKEKT
jgi:RNA polymerase sigma-70 factor (ECF subfamily)